MTTVAQVKNLVKPLLERHADLALVGRFIYVRPVQHFVRAILIGRTSSPDDFNPRWAVMHLFEARRFFALSWGDYLYNERSSRPGLWKVSQPDLSEALAEQIEGKVLPILRGINSLDDYMKFVSQHYFRHQLFDWPQSKIIADVALGDLASAKAIAERNIERWSIDQPYYDEEDRQKYRRIRELCACLAEGDRAGLARLLHEWEGYTVNKLKIEYLWQPTPFPIEQQTVAG